MTNPEVEAAKGCAGIGATGCRWIVTGVIAVIFVLASMITFEKVVTQDIQVGNVTFTAPNQNDWTPLTQEQFEKTPIGSKAKTIENVLGLFVNVLTHCAHQNLKPEACENALVKP